MLRLGLTLAEAGMYLTWVLSTQRTLIVANTDHFRREAQQHRSFGVYEQ